jgi:hypothetical protein
MYTVATVATLLKGQWPGNEEQLLELNGQQVGPTVPVVKYTK